MLEYALKQVHFYIFLSKHEFPRIEKHRGTKNKPVGLVFIGIKTGNKIFIIKNLFGKKKRNITLFEKYIRARLTFNFKVLNLAGQEITPVEAAYLSQYPGLEKVEKLDLRKNQLGDEGLEVLLNSEKIRNVQELDLRNNQITRQGMLILSKNASPFVSNLNLSSLL